MTHRHRRIACVLGMFVLAATAHDAAAQAPAVEIVTNTRVRLAPGATVELRAVNGEATFLNAPGDQVGIEYARYMPVGVKILMLTTPDGLTLCTVYPSSDVKKPTECLAGGKGRLTAGKAKDEARVQFRIQVPAGVHVKATIDRGDLKSSGITGNLHLYSNNGDLLVYDAGGPGTIDAGVGLLGNIDAVIAKAQKGPTLRQVRLAAIGSGRVRVGLPTSVTVTYKIASQQPAQIASVFHVEKVAPPVLLGHIGPAGESQVRLDVDTGIAGRFILLPTKN